MNRREALRTLAAGGATGALAAGAIVATAPAEATAGDPCLVFVTTWSAVTEACNTAPRGTQDAFYDTYCEPFETHAAEGRIPGATTMEGAAAALRKVIEFDDIEGQDRSLVLAALAYLEGRA